MPYELFLALRYLRSKRRGRRAGARVTALAGVAGIACGVGSLIFALALSNGFQDEMRDKILGGTAHITVTRADGSPVKDYQAITARLRNVKGVVNAAPTTYAGALLNGTEGAAYAVARGVEQTSARTLAEIRRTLTEGAVESLFEETRDAADKQREATTTREATHGQKRATKGEAKGEAGSGTDSGAGVGLMLDALIEGDDAPPVPVVVGAELAARTGLGRVGDEGWLVTGERTPEPPGLAPHSQRVRVV
ncbi:MAG TPA: ABC transporter permease, partial [Pyrinomonadaceae bacterium]|nr:ABC transporter permease [Pyrinomonadaceae bacterium]